MRRLFQGGAQSHPASASGGKAGYHQSGAALGAARLVESLPFRREDQAKIDALHGGDKMLKTNLFNGLCRWQLAQSESGNKA